MRVDSGYPVMEKGGRRGRVYKSDWQLWISYGSIHLFISSGGIQVGRVDQKYLSTKPSIS